MFTPDASPGLLPFEPDADLAETIRQALAGHVARENERDALRYGPVQSDPVPA